MYPDGMVSGFFTYPRTGGEPYGKYVFFLAAAAPGGLADGSIGPDEVVAFNAATVVFAP